MIARMESQTGTEVNALVDDEQIKWDPEAAPVPAVRVGVTVAIPNGVKEELEGEEPKPNLTAVPAGDNMFDEVDGPEFVDLTYQGIAEVDGVEHFVCENFKIRQISQPFVVIRPLSSLHGMYGAQPLLAQGIVAKIGQDCIKSKHIILDPSYQRSVVWDETRASNLITSVLMGYFIPPIIFNVVSKLMRGRLEHKRVCVDGKQRLISVQKFMNGQIGFHDCNQPSKKWYYCHPNVDGVETWSNHNILPEPVKEFFRGKSFCCYEYEDLTEETEETMFQLVQRGVALTPAEKMRAMSTEWALFAKQYEEDYDMVVNLARHNRASGFRITLTILTMIQEVNAGRRKRASAPALQASPQALTRILESKEPINPLLKLRFKSIFDRIENLVILSSRQITGTKYEIKRNSVFAIAPDFLRGGDIDHVKTFSPLELIGTAILVSYHMDNRNDQELLEDIKQMRCHLRKMHKDLRVNAQCWITVWEYIMEVEEARPSESMNVGNGAVDRQGDRSSSNTTSTQPAAHGDQSYDEDDDDDGIVIGVNGRRIGSNSATTPRSRSRKSSSVNGSSSVRASRKRRQKSRIGHGIPKNGIEANGASRPGRRPTKRQRGFENSHESPKKKSKQ